MGKKKQKKYELKTHKASAKRFEQNGGGKIMRTKGNQGHLRRNKSKRAKGQISKLQEVKDKKYKKTIRRLILDTK